MPMTIHDYYEVISAVAFGILFTMWRRDNATNIVFKLILGGLAVFGALVYFGLVIT